MQMSKYNKIPKVELHLHLDCSLSFEVVNRINPLIEIDEYRSSFQAKPNSSSLNDYISCADRAIELMQTKENLELVVEDLFKQLKKENVIYAEIRFAPLLHCSQNLNENKVVEIICNKAKIESKKNNIAYGLILCTLRHYSKKQSLETVRLVKQYKNKGVVGFDIAADEAGYPLDNHIEAFNYAKSNGLNITAHAGEAKGPESIWESIKKLHTKRIGHGVRCVEDLELVSYLSENDYHLEISLTSNIKTRTYKTYEDHPLNKIYNSSISISLNTDGRAISNTDLSLEYKIAEEKFGWTIDEIKKCNLEAIKHSFTSSSNKSKLIEKIINFNY
jgi:adenosine deaminase